LASPYGLPTPRSPILPVRRFRNCGNGSAGNAGRSGWMKSARSGRQRRSIQRMKVMWLAATSFSSDAKYAIPPRFRHRSKSFPRVQDRIGHSVVPAHYPKPSLMGGAMCGRTLRAPTCRRAPIPPISRYTRTQGQSKSGWLSSVNIP